MSACSWPTSNFLVECCLRRTWATLTGQYSHAILCQHGRYNIVQVIFLEKKLSVCHELTLHRWFPSAMFIQTDPGNIVHYWTGTLLKHCTGKTLCNAVLEASGNIAPKKIFSMFSEYSWDIGQVKTLCNAAQEDPDKNCTGNILNVVLEAPDCNDIELPEHWWLMMSHEENCKHVYYFYMFKDHQGNIKVDYYN